MQLTEMPTKPLIPPLLSMLTKFSVGQVWKYKTRDHEKDSRIVVVRVDTDDPDYGTIVHIYITKLDIPNPNAPSGKTVYVGHMPYEEDALSQSVTELESETDTLPDYQAGYELWKAAFDDSDAGVFALPVSEAVDSVEQSI